MKKIIWLMSSHPARGAWIEIGLQGATPATPASRTPQGVRGLKCQQISARMRHGVGRTPQGVRGLKLNFLDHLQRLIRSHPARGAWIEIAVIDIALGYRPRSRTPQGVRGLK